MSTFVDGLPDYCRPVVYDPWALPLGAYPAKPCCSGAELCPECLYFGSDGSAPVPVPDWVLEFPAPGSAPVPVPVSDPVPVPAAVPVQWVPCEEIGEIFCGDHASIVYHGWDSAPVLWFFDLHDNCKGGIWADLSKDCRQNEGRCHY